MPPTPFPPTEKDPRNFATTDYPTGTPWGHPDLIAEVRRGIISYSTPSHGGYWLDAEREAKLQERLAGFAPFASRQWYEEDNDVLAVWLAFPFLFPDHLVFAAVNAAKLRRGELGQWGRVYARASPEAMRRHNRFAERSRDWWRIGGLLTGGQGWRVSLYRRDERRVVEMADYPRYTWYSDAELADIAGSVVAQ